MAKKKAEKQAERKCPWCEKEFPAWMDKCPRCGWEVDGKE